MEGKWGFHCFPHGLGPLDPRDTDEYVTAGWASGFWEDDVFNYGYFGGFWSRSPRVEATTPPQEYFDPNEPKSGQKKYDRWNIFELERGYQTGAYSPIKHVGSGYPWVDKSRYDEAYKKLVAMAWPNPLPHTADQYRVRATACVVAYGGKLQNVKVSAGAVHDDEDQWLASRGYFVPFSP
ncbi:MAG: hypothetical protein HY744_05165 [Deltaproteobacteria bacterium]|nr:hypothetical protein [Deltaproteobacteria bacterium]